MMPKAIGQTHQRRHAATTNGICATAASTIVVRFGHKRLSNGIQTTYNNAAE